MRSSPVGDMSRHQESISNSNRHSSSYAAAATLTLPICMLFSRLHLQERDQTQRMDTTITSQAQVRMCAHMQHVLPTNSQVKWPAPGRVAAAL
jgi:hypothetical protein